MLTMAEVSKGSKSSDSISVSWIEGIIGEGPTLDKSVLLPPNKSRTGCDR